MGKKEKTIRVTTTLGADILFMIFYILVLFRHAEPGYVAKLYNEPVYLAFSLLAAFIGSIFLFSPQWAVRIDYLLSPSTPQFKDTGLLYKIFYYVFHGLLVITSLVLVFIVYFY